MARVGVVLKRIERYANDEEYREKKKKYYRERYKRSKETDNLKKKIRNLELSIWADKRCEKCGKLLNHRTQSGRCRLHKRKT